MSSMLRPEAEKINLNELTKSQREAVTNAVELLKDAAESSVPSNHHNSSRLLFLSGPKGTGKTTLIKTVQSLFNEDADRTIFTKTISEEDDREYAEFLEKLKSEFSEGNGKESLRNSVHWLDNFSLDPMPSGTNILGAILARLELFVNGNRISKKVGPLESISTWERAKYELANVRTDAIQAYENNIVKYEPSMDLESYSTVVSHVELTKINISKRLERALDNIIANQSGLDIHNSNTIGFDRRGIYVVVIDDLDLRPEKAIEVIKLAYSLPVRRLFFVFIGILEDLDEVLFYQVQGEYRKLMDHHVLSEDNKDIKAIANEVSSSLLRKLIPVAHRVIIDSMNMEETFKYQRDSENKETADSSDDKMIFSSILNNIEVDNHFAEDMEALIFTEDGAIPDVGTQISKFSFLDLIAQGTRHGDAQDVEPLYDGSQVLNAPPRQIADLYATLRKVDENKSEEGARGRASALIKALFQDYKGVIDEDGHLTSNIQRTLKESIEEHSIWEMSCQSLFAKLIDGDGVTLSPLVESKFGLNTINLNINCKRILREDLWVRDQQEYLSDNKKTESTRGDGSIESHKLGDRTRASLKLIHDLMKMSGQGTIRHDVSCVNLEEISSTVWQHPLIGELVIPWGINPWKTFFHRDHFFDDWSNRFEHLREILIKRSICDEICITAMAFLSWIEATNRTVRRFRPFRREIDDSIANKFKECYHDFLDAEDREIEEGNYPLPKDSLKEYIETDNIKLDDKGTSNNANAPKSNKKALSWDDISKTEVDPMSKVVVDSRLEKKYSLNNNPTEEDTDASNKKKKVKSDFTVDRFFLSSIAILLRKHTKKYSDNKSPNGDKGNTNSLTNFEPINDIYRLQIRLVIETFVDDTFTRLEEGYSDLYTVQMRDVLIELILLIMPETGFTNVLKRLLDLSDTTSVGKEQKNQDGTTGSEGANIHTSLGLTLQTFSTALVKSIMKNVSGTDKKQSPSYRIWEEIADTVARKRTERVGAYAAFSYSQTLAKIGDKFDFFNSQVLLMGVGKYTDGKDVQDHPADDSETANPATSTRDGGAEESPHNQVIRQINEPILVKLKGHDEQEKNYLADDFIKLLTPSRKLVKANAIKSLLQSKEKVNDNRGTDNVNRQGKSDSYMSNLLNKVVDDLYDSEGIR